MPDSCNDRYLPDLYAEPEVSYEKTIALSICTLVLSLICIGIVKISNYDIRKFGNLETTHCVTLVEKLKLR